MKFAVVASAVAGGVPTVIANAPNPAGRAILSHYLPSGVSRSGWLWRLLPTIMMGVLLHGAQIADSFSRT